MAGNFGVFAQRIWGVNLAIVNPIMDPSWDSLRLSLCPRFRRPFPPARNQFITTFNELYEFADLLRAELRQPPGELIEWISRANNQLGADPCLLIRARIHKLRQQPPNGPRSWPRIWHHTRYLDNQPRLDHDSKARLFVQAIELILGVWLMLAFGGAGDAGIAGAFQYGGQDIYDWPPLGDTRGIRLGAQERYEWQPLLNALVRQGHEYRRQGSGKQQGEDEGWYLESMDQYLHVTIRRILGRAEVTDYDRMFPGHFTLRDLVYMGNFNIVFTPNLLQHLRVTKPRDKSFRPIIYVFQNAVILEELSRTGPTTAYKRLAREALMTMALLIPHDQDSPGWFRYAREQNRKKEGAYMVDSQVGEQWRTFRSRRVSEFHYWQKRLLILEEEFETVSTWNLRTWWYDRRKGRDWGSFWIQICGFILAIGALLLAVTSTLIAALQGVQANHYAEEANTLASLANEYASNASTLDALQTNEPTTTYTAILLAGTTNFISTNINQINNNDCSLAQSTPIVAAREVMVACTTTEPSSWSSQVPHAKTCPITRNN
ncbi:hypothetical protein F5Y01DRAFT_327683 [Xylaria sp. FL0043]|nr:hypothetical protein F5Y01DRAFT_327683 [Xylaria sp. FL0043]